MLLKLRQRAAQLLLGSSAAPAPRDVKMQSIESLFGGLFSGTRLNNFTDYNSFLVAASTKLWVLWKCCDLIATAVKDTPYSPVDEKGKELTIPELIKLLRNPNERYTFAEILYLTVFHFLLTGNAYWAKVEANFKGDKPKELYVLNPRDVTLQIDPKRGLIGYLYRVNGIEIPFSPEEVMHFRRPHPYEEYYGLGIEPAQPLLQDAIDQQDLKLSFLSSGASPSTIVSLGTGEQVVDRTAWEKVQADFVEKYGGKKNVGKIMFLNAGLKVDRLSLTPSEMQSMESDKWTLQKIAMYMGVPLSVMGFEGAANFATARIEDMQFRRQTVLPMVLWLADTINSDLVAGYNPTAKLNWKVGGLIDMDAVVTYFLPLAKFGCYSPNELRVKAGDAALPDPQFDQHFVDASLVPIELSGINAPPAVASVAKAAGNIVDRSVDQLIARSKNGEGKSALDTFNLMTAIKENSVAVKAMADRPAPVAPAIVLPEAAAAPVVNVSLNLPNSPGRKVTLERMPDGKMVGTVTEQDGK